MWNINYLHSSGVLQVQASGEMNLPLIKKMTREVLFELLERDIYRSLIDLSAMIPMLSKAEVAELPDRLAALGLRRTSKIALIAPTDEQHGKSVHTFCRLAIKRGFMLRVFRDVNEALEWLAGITHQEKPLKPAHYSSQCFDATLAPAPLFRGRAQKLARIGSKQINIFTEADL